jgi:hypothetical protein
MASMLHRDYCRRVVASLHPEFPAYYGGIGFATLESINCVVCLDRSYLVGHGRLGKIQSLSGLGEVARLGQGDQRFQMTKFQHRGILWL